MNFIVFQCPVCEERKKLTDKTRIDPHGLERDETKPGQIRVFCTQCEYSEPLMFGEPHLAVLIMGTPPSTKEDDE
ncbi:hypothetical protein [Paenibacillus validus]|uniref:hypothetical protein n=1 Tax=Paenibacillus validus TaxID=44253 RepID=UPI003D2DFEF2